MEDSRNGALDAALTVIVDAARVVLDLLWSALRFLFDAASALLHSDKALSVDPLITLNAVGVAIAVFSLEQKISAQYTAVADGGPTTHEIRRRIELWRYVFEMVVIAGVFHLASIFLVLLQRSSCSDACPTAGADSFLVWATNSSLLGMVLILLAGMILVLRIVKEQLSPTNEKPSLHGNMR